MSQVCHVVGKQLIGWLIMIMTKFAAGIVK